MPKLQTYAFYIEVSGRAEEPDLVYDWLLAACSRSLSDRITDGVERNVREALVGSVCMIEAVPDAPPD